MARILVVDDDEQVRTTLRQTLEREGYDVVDAHDGNAGMKRFWKEGADLVITDIIMAEKEGLETIMVLSRDFPEVKIIAISGGGRVGPDEYLSMAKKFGAHLTLTKPFDREALLSAVRELLEKPD